MTSPGTQQQAQHAYGQPHRAAPVKPFGGFWIRVLAYLIDFIIVGVGLTIFEFIVAPDVAARRFDQDAPLVPMEVVFSMVSLGVHWLYQALLESGPKQATVGKMALGLKVTDLQGRRISFARATGRHFAEYLSAITFLIGYFMIGWTRYKQGLHDMIASTLVYQKDHVPQPAPPQEPEPQEPTWS